MLRVLTASLHLGLIVWHWEDLLDTSQLWHGTIRGVIEFGAVMVCLQHHRAVSKLLNKAVLALDGGVRDLGDFVASEAVPPLVGPFVDEINDVEGVDKIDERVANVAVVGEVDSQVHEVVFAPT